MGHPTAALNLSDLAAHFGRRAPFMIGRKGIEVLFGLITFAVLTRVLPREDYAIYGLVLSVISILRVTSLPGVGNALAQAFARGHKGDFKRATAISFTVSSAGTAILLALAAWHYQSGDSATAIALLVAALCFPPESGLKYWRNALVGGDRFDQLAMLDGTTFILRTIAIVSCAFLFPGHLFPIVLAALLTPAIINIAVSFWQVQGLASDATREKGTLRYGALLSLYEVPTQLAENVDRLVLFYVLGPETLAIYLVAMRIPLLLRAVATDTIAVFAPVFARQQHIGQDVRRFAIFLSLTVFAGCVLFALLFIPWLLPFLAGAHYADAVIYAQIMTLGVAAGTSGTVYFRFIKSQLDSRSFLHITLSRAMLDIPTVIGLTLVFGLYGTVAAFILKGFYSTVITGFVVHLRYGRLAPEQP